MKNLIIYCHPNPSSFNHAILDTVVATAEAAGHEVRIRDIYALDFQPVLSAADIVAFKSGVTPPDIAAEQAHITWADTITLIHPIWWSGMPGILKGYVDRVLSYGFAYRYGATGLEKLLAGKTMFIVNTVGSEEDNYVAKGIFHAMEVLADNTFGFTGLEILAHRFFAAVIRTTAAERQAYLDSLCDLYAVGTPALISVDTY
ncbi:NAD(P)H-dependent oxidoreductase [Chitinophaga nivalis]|uniref:NAD(P)H-dependent oxidoreductase n=1 Tax=Chitinophaga nivalis TaxID=2991709 RepID=A0ABT3IGS5_9BACT|nr:NAD(P)H-dependent oxidoreductase [Chitinophaga nivalis]MCW3467136.1 NAD(P)H-dependent oxidoreductase [Chitinophaga nivalis]MCW3483173.1 NAD(P)H-dependent oxidoreductase [Chitinophaga nivalis]